MINLRDKFTPETHQTRCGKPWELVSNNLGFNALLIKSQDLKGYDFFLWVHEDGEAHNRGGYHYKDYDLIPITYDPNISMKWKYAAMDEDGTWTAFSGEPTMLNEEWDALRPTEATFIADIFYFEPDPAGWKNSLYVRNKDGSWRRDEA